MITAAAARRLAGACALVAAAVVPIFTNWRSARVFDEERMILLRILLLPALAAGALALRALRSPLDRAVLAFAAASLIAALFSQVPANSLAGDYLRQGGLLTDLALCGAFVGARALAADRLRARLLVDVLCLGGAAAALLALAQSVVQAGGSSRAFAFAGGATFLGTHLAVVLPLALARARRTRDLALPLLLGAGLLCSASRAAILGALAGAMPALLACAPAIRRRALIAIGGACALLAIALLPPLRERLPADSLPNRVVAAFDGGDAATRLLLWRDAARAIAAEPARLLAGHGPDSIGPLFTARVSDDLQRAVGGNTRIDRFHADPLDALFTRGLLGLVALLAVAVLAIRAGWPRRAGEDRGERAGFAGAALAAAVDGALSVPGAVSRLVLFLSAGALAAERTGAEPARSEAAVRGILVALLVLVARFAVPSWSDAWIALPFLVLLRGPSLGRSATIAAIGLLGAGAAFVLLDLALGPSGNVFDPLDEVALRCAHTLTFDVAALAAVALLAAGRSAAGERLSRGRIAAGVVLALVVARALFDEGRRQCADVHQKLATALHHPQDGAGDPRVAATLLERAVALAPEVARYRVRLAAACVDAAAAGSLPLADAALDARVAIFDALQRMPSDAWLAAVAAQGLMRLRMLMPQASALLLAQARRVIDPAAAQAPTAVPVLQIAAEVALAMQDVERARALLQHALAIDNAPGTTQLLLGRVAAREGRVEDAAWSYSIALQGDAGRAEALAGVALCAASQGGTEEAAEVLLRLVPVAGTIDLRAAVDGARPLLAKVPYDAFAAMIDAARRRTSELRGAQRALDAIESALRY